MKIQTYYDDIIREYVACNVDNYDGCLDGNNELGYGETAAGAVQDLQYKLGAAKLLFIVYS